jgi:hypothetical protein
MDALKELAKYLAAVALLLGAMAGASLYFIPYHLSAMQIDDAQTPAVLPRIAVWREREEEDAKFEKIREEYARREQLGRDERSRSFAAARVDFATVRQARKDETPQIKVTVRGDELSARKRSTEQQVEERASRRANVGGLTAEHAKMRDNSGN